MLPPVRATTASRVAQGVARGTLLDQGCVARLVASVAAEAEPPRRRGRPRKMVDGEAEQAEPLARRAGNAGERGDGEVGQAEPVARKKRTYPSERGEKTADGKPKPDERTVADLVRRGWFKSEEAVVSVLTRRKTTESRFPFETAERTADWLEATLGPEPVKDGLCPAARAVKLGPSLLWKDAATLQLKWDALTLSPERVGVGIELSTEQAREAFSKHLPLLNYSVETYKAGWSMLLSTDGLDKTPEKARECIVRDPQILSKDKNNIVQRVALLESLGYPGARTMVLTNSRVLTYKDETVKESSVWWKHSGLDHLKIVTAMPSLLGGVPVDLQAKLDFLRRVAGMSNEDLNHAASLFGLSLDGRLRTRYFYALQNDRLGGRYGISTLMNATDATFVAMMQGGTTRDRASEAEVARYREEVASAEFVAWSREQEERLVGLDAL